MHPHQSSIKKLVSSNQLFRVLRNGNEFNALIPKSKCEKVNFGKGDTQFSIENIIKQALQHNHQLKEVAGLLTGNSLEETCFKNHDFAYNHFQYMADGEAQMLRSPACSWKQRNEGIDCKSYSIIVSSLLLQQGIKHYVRMIKQPAFNPTMFTHVYVIVPVNQKTGALTNGYYAIDGTLPTMREPIFIDEKSLYMDNLGNGRIGRNNGLNGLNGFKVPTTFSGVKELFHTPINCWGGSAFSEDQANNATNAIVDYFSTLITNINEAVKTNNLPEISRLDNLFYGTVWGAYSGYLRKKSEDWNSCTTARLDQQIVLLDYYKNKVLPVYNAWIKQFFNVTEVGKKPMIPQVLRVLVFISHGLAHQIELKPLQEIFNLTQRLHKLLLSSLRHIWQK